MLYHFRDLGKTACDEIARSVSHLLLGCRAVNVSFDSGVLHAPEWEHIQWEHIHGFPVTPVITEALLNEWPVSHEAYCDEWWVFDHPIPATFHVNPFCNFVGTTIDRYKELDGEEGCPLDTYLEQFSPLLVFGNNESGYLITRA